MMSSAGVTMPPQGTAEVPLVSEESVGLLDSSGKPGAKLKDLVMALNRLKVPAPKMIDLIETMHRTGRIGGKLIYEE